MIVNFKINNLLSAVPAEFSGQKMAYVCMVCMRREESKARPWIRGCSALQTVSVALQGGIQEKDIFLLALLAT